MMNEDKGILHNMELEYQVLSNLMNYPNLFSEYRELLSEDLFDFPKCRATFMAIVGVFDAGDVADLLTVAMWMNQNPQKDNPDNAELTEIYGYAISSVNFSKDVAYLAGMSKRRKYWNLGHRMVKAGMDFTVDISSIDDEIDALREENLQSSKDVYVMEDINAALTERINQNVIDERANMIQTGFSFIDEKGGFQLTDLIVIGGATSQGKTTLAVNMLVNGARNGTAGMFFSLEMTIQQLAARINAPISGVPSSLILFKKLYENQIEHVKQAMVVSNALPIFIDDSSKSYEKIKEKIRAMAIKRGVKVFYIDFLQRILRSEYSKESEAQFYECICQELKNLAKDLKVCIVLLSQLNRDVKDADPRPASSKLKASSGIEQASDTVILVYRPGYYGKRHKYRPELDPDKSAEIIIDKGRNFGVGSGYVGFKPELSLFYELEPGGNIETSQTRPAAEQQALPF